MTELATFPHPPRIGPADLAEELGLPTPTAEQAAVIEAPLAPAVVVAGAGSGKTETMSARVVWLVANGYLRPDQVLGLTFTNKAAAELSARVRARLAQLVRRGLASDTDGEPVILTYHAYAARLVAEHALRLAVEPTAKLLGEANSWQLSARVMRTYDGDLPHVDRAERTVIGDILDLSGEMAEHLADPTELTAWTQDFIETAEGLPPGKRFPRPGAKVREILDTARARIELLPLVQAYQQAKADTRSMDFGDQLSLAARIAQKADDVGRYERARYGVVLLDEFQDTGHAQLVLLTRLFGNGHPVTAVGDPCQSIYGWRGASAGGLNRFPNAFPAKDGSPAAVLPLSTSFRNDERVLAVANQLSTPLRDGRVAVRELTPGPAAKAGRVRLGLLDTADDEADWLADRLAAVWQEDKPRRDALKPGRSIAVLCRRRSQFERIADALRARGVPVELVGLGGLLATPEVRDVVSVLRVLSDPAAGDAVMRLLTGARWRIGPRDLAALGRRARELAAARRTGARRPVLSDERPAMDPTDEASLVEALDDLGEPARYSPDGGARLEALRQELRLLRRRTGQPLPELVADVERTLLLDIEVGMRDLDGRRPGAAGRVHLDRFLDVSARFTEDAEVASLSAFLAYLEAAEDTERGLEAGVVEVDADRVQVLTVHAAKGLEWDVVAVPGLTQGVFPDPAAGGSVWTRSLYALPYALRGDRDDLPAFEPIDAADQAELDALRKGFDAACKERGEREERRLAYVAVTRARGLLLCSGYWWDDAGKPRGPSVFLAELGEPGYAPGAVEVEAWADRPADGTVNPLFARRREAGWPYDPLRGRRPDVAAGAELVRAALADLGAPAEEDDGLWPAEDVAAQGWRDEADLLLAERAAQLARSGAVGPVRVPLPDHLSVSALVALRADPAELARQIRRPLPFRPAPLARRGTAFHAWLESRFGGDQLLDLDELPGAADADAAPDSDLELLQQRFEESEWGPRMPAEVEVPFETFAAGTALRGRMDAVFADDDGGWTVVDWKTGRRPTGRAAEAAAVQLAAYRIAWAELAEAPVEQVRAAFHYVRSNETVRPVDLLDASGLAALLTELPSDEP